MPTLRAEVTTTQTTEVKLSLNLQIKLRQELAAYAERQRQLKKLQQEQQDAKDNIEMLFGNDHIYQALEAGVKVNVPGLGVVPLKAVTGKTTKTLDKVRLMKQTGITLQDLEAATVEKPKKEYLSITLPGDEGSDGD